MAYKTDLLNKFLFVTKKQFKLPNMSTLSQPKSPVKKGTSDTKNHKRSTKMKRRSCSKCWSLVVKLILKYIIENGILNHGEQWNNHQESYLARIRYFWRFSLTPLWWMRDEDWFHSEPGFSSVHLIQRIQFD